MLPPGTSRCARLAVSSALTVLSFGLAAASAQADAGDLDPTFAGTGYIESLFEPQAPSQTAFRSIALQPSGRVVVAGSGAGSFALEGRTSAGALDSGFGTGGRTITTFPEHDGAAGRDMTLAGSGMVVVGSAGINTGQDLAVARYDSNGVLDPGFDGDGRVTMDFSGSAYDRADTVVATPDGGVIVGGTGAGEARLIKLGSTGVPDPDFGGGGVVTLESGSVTELVRQPDGKLLAVCGSLLLRFEADGSPDEAFGVDGAVDLGYDSKTLALQSDGRILVGSVERRLSDGSPDPSFEYEAVRPADPQHGLGGFAPRAVAVQSDGSVLAAGQQGNGDIHGPEPLAVSRNFADGSLDKGFGHLGAGHVPVSDSLYVAAGEDVLLTPDDEILVAGSQYYPSERALPGLIARFEGGPSPASEPPATSIEGIRIRGRHAFAAFAGTSDRIPPGDLAFECRVDRGPWRGCESPKQVRGRHRPGMHTFRVRAVDDQGDPDPTPASQRIHFPRG